MEGADGAPQGRQAGYAGGVKPAPFTYHRPETLAEAAEMAASLENARLLSGGQSLMPMMNLRYVAVDHLIDLNPVAELAGITIDGGRVSIGAMTRQRAVLEDETLARCCPVMREALGFVGHVQTRNRGTVGGSLAHLDPAAELPGLAALLDAGITLRSRDGDRTVAMADFPRGYMTPDIREGEVLTSLAFNAWPDGHGWDFREFARRHGDFAMAGAASLILLDRDGRIARAAVVLIGIDDGPVRLSDVERMLTGETPSDDLFRAAAALAADRPMAADALVTETYRRHLAGVLARRSLAVACARAANGGGHA
ncbi:MAG: xanthine dehydrogenase family protein subunit M [Rhodospirillales bacterium CG15_BIG_FIL_POST_REV_8_21_14_020_66_15]|nr:MAG: xanthine dehydrogenase family protein subunit M [Rhodospirillales bacterium CG15_BIG_FIL_POST_REV_8_21_14_020_66_15]